MEMLNPFPYPPPFLVAVALLGLSPFWSSAFPLWIGLLAGLFYFVFRKFVPRPFRVRAPGAVPLNVLVGQNGSTHDLDLLSGGLSLLNRRESAGGRHPRRFDHQAAARRVDSDRADPRTILARDRGRRFVGHAAAVGRARAVRPGDVLGVFRAGFPNMWRRCREGSDGPEGGQLLWCPADHGRPGRDRDRVDSGLAFVAAAMTWLAWARRYDTRVPLLAAGPTLLVSPLSVQLRQPAAVHPDRLADRSASGPQSSSCCGFFSFAALFAKLPNPTFIAATIALFVMWREASAEPAENQLRPEFGGGR